MNALAKQSDALIDILPPVKGRIRQNVALDKITWFQVGGPADVMFKPEDEADLSAFLKGASDDIDVFALGVGSNLLVRDGGFRGVVIRLGRIFCQMVIEDKTRLRVGAGALDINAARFAAEAGLTGAEFLSGIPGSIGGALRMNAGAYGREIKDILVSATAYDRQGVRHDLTLEDMGFSYRHSAIPADWIFTEAVFQLQRGDGAKIQAEMAEISKNRADSQPVKSRTGGSTFANPDGDKAWQLIDSVGGRGFAIGQAQVSDKHCNFLINNGGATAAQIEAVGTEIRRRVFQEHDTLLRWEIIRLGDTLDSKKGDA